MTRRLTLILTLLMLLVAACGGSDGSSPVATSPARSAGGQTAVTPTGAAGRDQTATSQPTAGTATEATVQVTATTAAQGTAEVEASFPLTYTDATGVEVPWRRGRRRSFPCSPSTTRRSSRSARETR